MNSKTIYAALAFFVLTTFAHSASVDSMFRGMPTAEKVKIVRESNFDLAARQTEANISWTAYKMNSDFAMSSGECNDFDAVLAEIFATAPECALPALADFLSVRALTKKAMRIENDSRYRQFVLSAMLRTYRRIRSDNRLELSNQRRIVFAVIAFLKASEKLTDEFYGRMLAFVPKTVLKDAKDVWIPTALGKADTKVPSYEPLLQASSNDVEYAKLERRNEDIRQLLKFPNSEQQTAKVTMAKLIDSSTMLLVPELEDDFDSRLPPQESHPEPKPYVGQSR